MQDLPDCREDKKPSESMLKLSQEFSDATYGQRRYDVGASRLAVAMDHMQQQLDKLSPEQQQCFEKQLLARPSFSSDQMFQMELIYLKENATVIPHNRDQQISKEGLQQHLKMPWLTRPEKIIVEAAIRDFDKIRSGDRFDGDSWVPASMLSIVDKTDNAPAITPTDITNHQRELSRYAGLEG